VLRNGRDKISRMSTLCNSIEFTVSKEADDVVTERKYSEVVLIFTVYRTMYSDREPLTRYVIRIFPYIILVHTFSKGV